MFAFSNKPRKSSVPLLQYYKTPSLLLIHGKVRKPTHNILKDVGGWTFSTDCPKGPAFSEACSNVLIRWIPRKQHKLGDQWVDSQRGRCIDFTRQTHLCMFWDCPAHRTPHRLHSEEDKSSLLYSLRNKQCGKRNMKQISWFILVNRYIVNYLLKLIGVRKEKK